jgi:hypothetical protein
MAALHLLSWISGAGALLLFATDLRSVTFLLSGSRANWERSLGIVRDLREKLETGWLPSPDEWRLLSEVEAPWGGLAQECVSELREGGIPIVPTLRRIEKAIGGQKKAEADARARSAQAWGQAAVCGAIVPLISVALYFLVPGLSQIGMSWWLSTLAAIFLSAIAMIWMLQLSEDARWGGLARERRSWWAATFCFGERLLGSLRGGTPADLAWSKALPQLHRQAGALVQHWGADLWSDPPVADARFEPAARSLIVLGSSLRKAIQASIYEGRGCAERIEAALEALRVELDCEVERNMQLLSTRALKPLFICVAPSVLLLLAMAFWLSWESWGIA